MADFSLKKLKCTKFNFGWGSTSNPTGEAHSTPQTPCWIWGKGRGRRKGERGKGK